jgi:hypothetical protein
MKNTLKIKVDRHPGMNNNWYYYCSYDTAIASKNVKLTFNGKSYIFPRNVIDNLEHGEAVVNNWGTKTYFSAYDGLVIRKGAHKNSASYRNTVALQELIRNYNKPQHAAITTNVFKKVPVNQLPQVIKQTKVSDSKLKLKMIEQLIPGLSDSERLQVLDMLIKK